MNLVNSWSHWTDVLSSAEKLTSMANRTNSISIVRQTKEVLSFVFEKYICIIFLQMASGSLSGGCVSIESKRVCVLSKPPQFFMNEWWKGVRQHHLRIWSQCLKEVIAAQLGANKSLPPPKEAFPMSCRGYWSYACWQQPRFGINRGQMRGVQKQVLRVL